MDVIYLSTTLCNMIDEGTSDIIATYCIVYISLCLLSDKLKFIV
jgi:hypothetical protein